MIVVAGAISDVVVVVETGDSDVQAVKNRTAKISVNRVVRCFNLFIFIARHISLQNSAGYSFQGSVAVVSDDVVVVSAVVAAGAVVSAGVVVAAGADVSTEVVVAAGAVVSAEVVVAAGVVVSAEVVSAGVIEACGKDGSVGSWPLMIIGFKAGVVRPRGVPDTISRIVPDGQLLKTQRASAVVKRRQPAVDCVPMLS